MSEGITKMTSEASKGRRQVFDALAQGALRAESEDQTLQAMGRGR